jgi:SAM-dependent methyltransferase
MSAVVAARGPGRIVSGDVKRLRRHCRPTRSTPNLAQIVGDIQRLQDNWEVLGRQDPLWAVLTTADKKNGAWDIEDFFSTGRDEIRQVLDDISSLGIAVARGSAVDFGCGVGRLTQALAEHFDRACGIDIARSMIEGARCYNRFGDRCTYRVNASDRLEGFADGSADFVYSCRVLQHVRPRLAKAYVAEMYRILAPCGVLYFVQTSAWRHNARGLALASLPSPVVNRLRRLRYGLDGVMELHLVPVVEMRALLDDLGAEVVSVTVEPSSLGTPCIAHRYCVRKAPIISG